MPKKVIQITQSKSKPSKRQVSAMIKKQLNKNLETKFNVHFVGTGANMTSAGTITALFTPVQGIADTNRIGDTVRLSSYAMNLAVHAQTSNTAPQTCRVILFQWDDVSLPTTGDVLEAGLGSTNSTMVYKHDNLESGRLRILEDKLVTISGSNDRKTVAFRFHGSKKLARKVQFTAGSTTGTNKIYIFYMSDQVSGYPLLYYDSVVNFKDA